MKHVFMIAATLLLPTTVRAQDPNPGMRVLREQRIEWSKIIPPKGNAGKSALLDTFSSWIKKSYISMGGLPQEDRELYPAGTKPPYLPKGEGMYMNFWVPCYDKTGKGITRAQPASQVYIGIETNNLPGREEANGFGDESHYYFTMYYDQQARPIDPEITRQYGKVVEEVRRQSGFPLVYLTSHYAHVILTPEKELAIEPVTRREILDHAPVAIKRHHALGNIPDHLMKSQLEAVEVFRERYKNSLDEPAMLRQSQLNWYAFDKDFDLFQPSSKANPILYPLYKIKTSVYDAAKAGKTSFVTVSFPFRQSNTSAKAVYKAMMSTFNYQYVYNYFFAPEKVKGKTYTPLQPVQ